MLDLLDFCVAQQDDLRSTVETLVRLESPSTDKVAVDRCGDVIASFLKDFGADVTRIAQAERGNHVRAEFGGGPRRVLLLGHFDTVWDLGQLERMPVREEN